MQPEILFSLFSTVAMVGWLILIILPRRWSWLNQIPALANVQLLFTNPMATLAGWVHYLAFDLFVGGWIAKKADELHISRLIQAPILLATFMFGPLGYLLFMLLKGSNTLGLKQAKKSLEVTP